jgi:hypothetical protein
MRILKRLLLAALVTLVPPVAFAIGIESVTLRADDNGEPGEVVETFIPTDTRLHFEIKLDEVAIGSANYVVEIWAVDTTAGQDIRIADFKGDALVANVINVNISLPREWPVGLYRLDVTFNGEAIGSHEFDVAEPETEE